MLLKDKRAVVTGCNRGIGKAVLETMARNGADVWACVKNESEDFLSLINELERKHQA